MLTGEANWPFAPLIDLQVWCRKCPNTQSKVVLPAIPLVLRITSAVLWIFCSSLPFRCGSFNAILGVGLQLPHLFSSGGTTAFTLHYFFLGSYTVLQPSHVLRECKRYALHRVMRRCVSPKSPRRRGDVTARQGLALPTQLHEGRAGVLFLVFFLLTPLDQLRCLKRKATCHICDNG